MFARNVSANLKPGTLAEFTETMENEIVPWLRKQKGFLDAITLAVPAAEKSWQLASGIRKRTRRLITQRVIPRC